LRGPPQLCPSPGPRSHRSKRPAPCRKCKPRKTPGTPATLRESPSPTRRTPIWRNRDIHIAGRPAIIEFLTAKWQREQDYALRKQLWGFRGNRIAVRFQYEWHDADDQWWRSYGNELWEFDPLGLMTRREASINDRRIGESERRILGPRPENERGVDLPVW
jgi:nuclear transport factor 2 (NTF2) superfamily protein